MTTASLSGLLVPRLIEHASRVLRERVKATA